MIEKNEMKKMLRKIFHSESGSLVSRQIMHPAREWFVGLFAGLIMLGFGGFWSVNSYLQYNEVSRGSESGPADVAVYKSEVIKEAQADFNERAVKYERLKEELLDSNRVVISESTSTTSSELKEVFIDTEESGSVLSEDSQDVFEEDVAEESSTSTVVN